jgi:hypothetical protein
MPLQSLVSGRIDMRMEETGPGVAARAVEVNADDEDGSFCCLFFSMSVV